MFYSVGAMNRPTKVQLGETKKVMDTEIEREDQREVREMGAEV